MTIIERIKEELTRDGGLIFRREEVSALVEYYEAAEAWFELTECGLGRPGWECLQRARAALEKEEG